jgi:hypothetical protein
MDYLRRVAWVSVARGCGFGLLAICTMTIGFINKPGLAFNLMGIGLLLMAVILIVKARNSDSVMYQRTEIWLMLNDDMRPPAAVAQSVISRIRAAVLLEFALMSACGAAASLGIAAVLLLIGYH